MPSLHNASGFEPAAAEPAGVLGFAGWAGWVTTLLTGAVTGALLAGALPATGGRLGRAVTVTVCSTVIVGAAARTVTVVRGAPAMAASRLIGRVELPGSEWPAPPMTTPAMSPSAAASSTGRRHRVLVGSPPTMPS